MYFQVEVTVNGTKTTIKNLNFFAAHAHYLKHRDNSEVKLQVKKLPNYEIVSPTTLDMMYEGMYAIVSEVQQLRIRMAELEQALAGKSDKRKK